MKEERKLMKDERKHHGAVDKTSSNNRSVLRTASAFVMLKIGPVRLALVGLTAGRQAGSPAGRQTKILLFNKFLKYCNSTSNAFIGCLNGFLALITLYQ